MIRCPLPSCGDEMVKRRNKKTGGLFLGCKRWPFCTETMEIPEREKMLAAGAQELPGFETEGAT